MQALLKTVTNGVLTKTEAQVDALGGRPDIGVEVAKALCGFVELKAPGHGARTRDFKGRDKDQWKKFSAPLSEILAAPAFQRRRFFHPDRRRARRTGRQVGGKTSGLRDVSGSRSATPFAG